MPVTQDRLTRLREFGLSEYAARAYLALLDLGIAEARDVSSLSKVPQAKIYHVLEQLHEKGLVSVLPEYPKKYAPVPFQEYLDRLYEEHTKAADTIERERDELAELYRVMGDIDVGDRGFFTVLRGRRNVLAKIEEMLTDAKRDMLVLGTVGSAGRTLKLAPEVERARRRGVRLRFLVPLESGTVNAFADLTRLAEVRARDLGEGEQSAKVGIVTCDGRSAFLIHFVPDDASLVAGKDIGVFTDQEAMVAALLAILEPHWSRAAPFDTRREELETGRAPPFGRILPDADAALAALEHSLRSVAPGEVRAAGAALLQAPAFARLLDAGAPLRALATLDGASTLDALRARLADAPHADVRHADAATLPAGILLDEREAFLPLTPDAAGPILHTNDANVIRALRDRFDAAWSTTPAPDARRKESDATNVAR